MLSSLILVVATTIIIICYSIIALQFYLAIENIPKEKRKKKSIAAMRNKILIFLLCALSGYVSKLFSLPIWFQEITRKKKK